MSKQLEHNESQRAATINTELNKIVISTKQNFFSICELLMEFCENDYHKHFGCNSFSDWIDQSDLDMSPRQAYYYLSIGKKTRELGLSRDDVGEIPISKLKEILSLEPATHADTIKGMLAESDNMSIEEVKAKVRGLKTDSGEEIYVHYNFKLPELTKETVDEAFELVRRKYGSVVDEATGEIKELSPSKCLEFVCVSYIQDRNNHAIEGHAEVVTV